MFDIEYQRPGDGPIVERLLDLCFEPQRRLRPTYRLRDGFTPVDGLSFVALDNGWPIGTLRFWPIMIGDAIDGASPALLLGPLAVHPDVRNRGGATRLVQRGLDEARRHGHGIVVAVGEFAFLARFGFYHAGMAGLVMPLPVADARFLVCEITAGALTGVAGTIGPARVPVVDVVRPVSLTTMASR
jgi:predicted N-acetyltransferase YhbS